MLFLQLSSHLFFGYPRNKFFVRTGHLHLLRSAPQHVEKILWYFVKILALPTLDKWSSRLPRTATSWSSNSSVSKATVLLMKAVAKRKMKSFMFLIEVEMCDSSRSKKCSGVLWVHGEVLKNGTAYRANELVTVMCWLADPRITTQDWSFML